MLTPTPPECAQPLQVEVELPGGDFSEASVFGFDSCPHPSCTVVDGQRKYRLCGLEGNRNGKRQGYHPNCWKHELAAPLVGKRSKPFRRLQVCGPQPAPG